MIAHSHPSRAASHACTDPDCQARLLHAQARGSLELARIDGEKTAREEGRKAAATARWAEIADQMPAWQVQARATIEERA